MLLHLKSVLGPTELARVRDLTAAEPFVEGRGTATGSAAAVKNNLQLRPESDRTAAAGAYLLDCLRAHPLFMMAVQPRGFAQPLFARYEAGMSYGYHLDAAVLHRAQTIRSDLSVTVFLNEPTEYDGGELIIDVGSESLTVKGDAGDCIVYPSTTFHRVAEVTRGVRLVSAVWAQSLVRDAARREVLYELGCAIRFYDVSGTGGPYLERLRRCEQNLLRLWIEM
jgi:PKHD-type hydroxylase